MICGKKGQTITIVAGVFLVLFGLILQVYWEKILFNILRRKFVLSKSSRTYDSWVKTKVPVYCIFYFFNWTNPGDLSDWDYKPEFDEVGPYVFVESLEKVNIVWHDNGTVSYRMKRVWHFDRELSGGSLSDLITSVNPVSTSTDYLARYSFSIQTLTRLASPDSFRMKLTKTVDELLFTGYDDRLIDLGRFSQIFLPVEIPYDRFGWWYPRNGSISETYNMETGENGMHTFGLLNHFDYKNHTGHYKGHCGEVRGSGGNFWAWNQERSGVAEVFSSDLCRFIKMPFMEEISYDGLIAYKYHAGPRFIDNGTLYSENKCFCNGECIPSGAFNASSCGKGAPVFISFPHFLYADPYYTDNVVGMKPNASRHDMYLTLEPNYGVPLHLTAPIQLNLLIERTIRSSDWNRDRKRRLFFPVLWVDQTFRIKKKDLRTMKMLQYLPTIGFIMSVILMAIGAVFILTYFIRMISHKSKTVPFGELRKNEVYQSKISGSNHNIKIYHFKNLHL